MIGLPIREIVAVMDRRGIHLSYLLPWRAGKAYQGRVFQRFQPTGCRWDWVSNVEPDIATMLETPSGNFENVLITDCTFVISVWWLYVGDDPEIGVLAEVNVWPGVTGDELDAALESVRNLNIHVPERRLLQPPAISDLLVPSL
jgi:hypothetical protein